MFNKLIGLVLLSYFILISAVYVFGPGFSDTGYLYADILYLFAALFAVLGGLFATKTYGLKNKHGKYMALITVAFLCWLIGEVVWVYLDWVLSVDPFPSVADYFYLSGYIFLFLGLLGAACIHKTSLTSLAIMPLITAALILSGVTFYFGIYTAYDASATLLENAVGMFYGVGDLVMILFAFLTVAFVGEYKGGALSRGWFLLMLGLFPYWLADILFAMFTDAYTESAFMYILIDLLWISGFLLFAAGSSYIASAIINARSKLLNKLVE